VLEDSLLASASRADDLTRQLTDLHSAYATAQKERDDALAGTTFSPRGAKSLFLSPADEHPRIPSGPGSPSPHVPMNRTVDAILPAAVRHRRQVSLSALKARMEPSSRVPSSRMAPLLEEGDASASSLAEGRTLRHVPKQFGDEIVFCCPACEGDLITL
jgi:hypothetical protein